MKVTRCGHRRTVCELTRYKSVGYLDTLGAALSEAWRFPGAIAMTKQAIAVATPEGRKDLVTLMQDRLDFYRAGRNYTSGTRAPTGNPP